MTIVVSGGSGALTSIGTLPAVLSLTQLKTKKNLKCGQCATTVDLLRSLVQILHRLSTTVLEV